MQHNVTLQCGFAHVYIAHWVLGLIPNRKNWLNKLTEVVTHHSSNLAQRNHFKVKMAVKSGELLMQRFPSTLSDSQAVIVISVLKE